MITTTGTAGGFLYGIISTLFLLRYSVRRNRKERNLTRCFKFSENGKKIRYTFDAFESVLNGFLRRKNLDVYVTGSNSKFLSKDILTEFRGRGDEVHVLPLSFSEYYAFKQGDKECRIYISEIS